MGGNRYYISDSFDLNHISYKGRVMRNMKQKPRKKYDVIKDKENTSDLYLINQGPDKFIIVPTKFNLNNCEIQCKYGLRYDYSSLRGDFELLIE